MLRKVAAVIFVNNKNEILLLLRDDKPSIPYPNTWGLIGGHTEENETCEQALFREVKEEIGYDIENPEFIGKFNDKSGAIVYAYRSSINKKVEELHLTEGQKLCFFSFNDIMQLKNLPMPLNFFLLKNKESILKDFL
jgi:8-oxo-dGTP diphosphatase